MYNIHRSDRSECEVQVKSKIFPSVAPSSPNVRGGFQFLGGAWPPLVPILFHDPEQVLGEKKLKIS